MQGFHEPSRPPDDPLAAPSSGPSTRRHHVCCGSGSDALPGDLRVGARLEARKAVPLSYLNRLRPSGEGAKGKPRAAGAPLLYSLSQYEKGCPSGNTPCPGHVKTP